MQTDKLNSIFNRVKIKSTIHVKKQSLAVALASSFVLVGCGGGGANDDTANTQNSQNDNQTNANSNPASNSNNNSNSNSSTNSNPNALETNAALAKNLVDNLAIPAYKNFATSASGLSGQIQGYCDAIGKANEDSSKKSAQSAWNNLKNAWQATHIFQVGPVAANSGSLANVIYTRNNFDSSTQSFIAAQVKQRKANANYVLANNVTNKARGLDALEYLLFADVTAKKDNCLYAVAVAQDIKKGADAIVSAWNAPTGRNSVLTNKESNGVDLVQPFFNSIVTTIDKTLKDADLGIPLSIKNDGACNQNSCPEMLEHPISKTSYGSIDANLKTLKAVFLGNGGAGFDTFYQQKNMQSQRSDFIKKIDNALATINAQSNNNLYDQLTNIKAKKLGSKCQEIATKGSSSVDNALAPCKLYHEIKQLSDEVKTGSFKLAVNLTLPTAAAGDGD